MKIILRLLKLIVIAFWIVLSLFMLYYIIGYYIITGKDISDKYLESSIKYIDNLFKL